MITITFSLVESTNSDWIISRSGAGIVEMSRRDVGIPANSHAVQLEPRVILLVQLTVRSFGLVNQNVLYLGDPRARNGSFLSRLNHRYPTVGWWVGQGGGVITSIPVFLKLWCFLQKKNQLGSQRAFACLKYNYTGFSPPRSAL